MWWKMRVSGVEFFKWVLDKESGIGVVRRENNASYERVDNYRAHGRYVGGFFK